MKLRARAFGIAVGILGGIALFLATFASLSWGTGEILNKLAVVMPGYARSAGGAFLGILWGFVYGFVGGALVAWLYNQFCKVLYKS
jgi:hypothetical protein